MPYIEALYTFQVTLSYMKSSPNKIMNQFYFEHTTM